MEKWQRACKNTSKIWLSLWEDNSIPEMLHSGMRTKEIFKWCVDWHQVCMSDSTSKIDILSVGPSPIQNLGWGTQSNFTCSIIFLIFHHCKSLVAYWISHPYLTGVATAQLHWYLSNMNVKMSNRYDCMMKQISTTELQYPTLLNWLPHYNDVIMRVMASQITSLMIVYSTVYSGADQRKHQSSTSLVFVRGIHQWPVYSPHKGPVTWNMFPFDDVFMAVPAMSWSLMMNIDVLVLHMYATQISPSLCQ